MAQVVPSEILHIMANRPQLKSAGIRSHLPANVLAMIDTIRADIPSGEDADGWSKVCRNWRSGGSAAAGPAGGGMYHPRAPPGRGSSHRSSAPTASAQMSNRTWDTRKTTPLIGVTGPAVTGANIGSTERRNTGPVITDDRPRFTNSTPVATSVAPAAETAAHPPPHKYVSRFKSATEPVEATIVNTIILNKLNKFSPANYDECKEFLMEILGSGETDFLADFMRLVFRKAAAEETFCPLYAKLLNDLASGYPFLLNEMAALYEKFMDIFQEVDEGAREDMEEFIQKNKEKKYRKGYAQFLAELLKYNIVERQAFTTTLRQIIQQLDALSRQAEKSNTLEEYADCLVCILNALKGTSAAGLAMKEAIRADALAQLMPLTARSEERPSLTNRIRFTILNATDYLKV